jgi:RNA polymerase sigma factor (sigma-70 family)
VEHAPAVETRTLLVACAAGAEDPRWPELVPALDRLVRGGVLSVLARSPERRDPDLIDELAQEVWCRLLARDRRALRTCAAENDRVVQVYVRRIASRVTIDVLRRRAAARRRPAYLGRYDESFDGAEHALDWRGSPERRAIARERIRGLLELCAAMLGPRSRARSLRVVRLAWIEGFSSEEIAERIGAAPGAVDSLLSRLRAKLATRGVVPAARSSGRGRLRGGAATPG